MKLTKEKLDAIMEAIRTMLELHGISNYVVATNEDTGERSLVTHSISANKTGSLILLGQLTKIQHDLMTVIGNHAETKV